MKPYPPAKTIRYKKSHRMVLPVEQLQVGMYVAELDRPWEETNFLFQGFLLENEDDVRLVREQCESVTVDILSSVDVELGRRGAPAAKTRRVEKQLSVERALPKAQTAYTQTRSLVSNILDDVRLGKTVNTPEAKEAVGACVDSVMENPDALMLMTRLRNKDEYTAEHSLSVSILSIALGRQIGLERAQLNELGLCGMLHDVGKMMIPDEILNKPGSLSDGEMAIMEQHTVHGRDILMSTPDLPGEAPDVAHNHHERINGSGYPRGLRAENLTWYTKLVSVVDTFDAITSDRIYQRGQTNMAAFKILTQGRGTSWDPDLVFQFIEAVGIYPPGSVAQLSSGEIVVVLESNPKLKLRPKVLVINANMEIGRMRVIDLAETSHDREGQRLYIARMLHPRDAGVDLDAMREMGIFGELGNSERLP